MVFHYEHIIADVELSGDDICNFSVSISSCNFILVFEVVLLPLLWEALTFAAACV